MPTTTIQLDTKLRDRLRSFGTAGMTYNDILQRVLDEVDRKRFVDEMHRLADQVDAKDLIPLKDVDWS